MSSSNINPKACYTCKKAKPKNDSWSCESCKKAMYPTIERGKTRYTTAYMQSKLKQWSREARRKRIERGDKLVEELSSEEIDNIFGQQSLLPAITT